MKNISQNIKRLFKQLLCAHHYDIGSKTKLYHPCGQLKDIVTEVKCCYCGKTGQSYYSKEDR